MSGNFPLVENNRIGRREAEHETFEREETTRMRKLWLRNGKIGDTQDED